MSELELYSIYFFFYKLSLFYLPLYLLYELQFFSKVCFLSFNFANIILLFCHTEVFDFMYISNFLWTLAFILYFKGLTLV